MKYFRLMLTTDYKKLYLIPIDPGYVQIISLQRINAGFRDNYLQGEEMQRRCSFSTTAILEAIRAGLCLNIYLCFSIQWSRKLSAIDIPGKRISLSDANYFVIFCSSMCDL